MRIGIIGLPNVGKSTLFNALTRSFAAKASNYPFCTVDPNVGVVEVPDTRLSAIAEIVKPATVIPATVEFVDIAGLVRGASKGEGLGNAFLSHIREVHAICHVLRGFSGDDVIHVEGSVNPARDRETVEMELALADLVTVKKRISTIEGASRTGSKEKQQELEVLRKLEEALQEGLPAFEAPPDLHLLTVKPVIYVLNISETQLKSFSPEQARVQLKLPATSQVIGISAKIEEDLQNLSTDDTAAFLQELGVASSGLDQLIRAAYALLGYLTFFTAGPKEVRAWTITKGMTAPEAAGVIHSDFQRGFIAAETIAFENFVGFRGEQGSREAGKLRTEGKAYVVQDGDVLHVRFNV